jgi:hypothetical protein
MVAIKDKGTRAELRDCTITDIEGPGLFIYNGTRAELRDCTITDSEGPGLFIFGKASVSMIGGAVRSCAGAGVNLSDAGTQAEVRKMAAVPCSSLTATHSTSD